MLILSSYIGWDKTQTIDSLLRKGGFRGQITPDIRRSVKLTRYQAQAIQMTYNEYRDKLERQQMNQCNGKMLC